MTFTPIQISIVSALIAVAALLVSLIAVWKMHFGKFNVLSAVGNLRHRESFAQLSEKNSFNYKNVNFD